MSRSTSRTRIIDFCRFRRVAAPAVIAAGLATVCGIAILSGIATLPATALGYGGESPSPTYPGTYAFIDVNVVPLDALTILEHQTVLVRDGVIREIGDLDSVEIPVDAVRIDGEGRYLLPGLGDMFARLPAGDATSGEIQDLLFLYLANGVTTVRQGSGEDAHLTLKSRLSREQVLGPTLYVTSPPLQVQDGLTADSMEAAIARVARGGWDLLQVPRNISRPMWNLFSDEIADYAIEFGGPVPETVGLRHALVTGMSTVDHLDGLVEAAAGDEYEERIRRWFEPEDSIAPAGPALADPAVDPPAALPPLDSLAASLSLRKARAVGGRARAAGVWIVPTLSLWERREVAADADSLASLPEMVYVARETLGRWITEKRQMPRVDAAAAGKLAEARMAAVKALSDAGGGLLLGTDSPELFNVPGFSVHREMELLEAAGITPYEVLLAGTRNVARYASSELGQAGDFGTVAEGNRADLVLVEGNPLEDLGALRRKAGVMVRGRWLPASEIRDRLEAIAERNR